MVPWVAFSFLTPIAWAISNVFAVVWKPADGDARSSALGMMLVSGMVLWLAVAAFGHGYTPRGAAPSPGDVALLLNALVAGLAFVLYFTLLDRAGPVVMSFVSFLNLGLVTLYGIAFFGERPSLWVLAAIAAIVAGLEIIRRAPPGRQVPQKVR
jgi:drug/metabolite transporter (DMT)-like permease